MTPRAGTANKYPIVVASRVRSILEHRRLDTRLRARIRAKRHALGWSYAPVDPADKEACDWIDAQVKRYGAARWQAGAGRYARRDRGWTKEKSKKESE